jgi:NADH-quinone oxidoreductase subunit M
MLICIISLLIFYIGFLSFFFSNLKLNLKEIKILTLIFSLSIFNLSLFLWLFFENNNIFPQFLFNFQFFQFFNLTFFIGIDGYSLFLILLTTFIIPICILVSWHMQSLIKKHLLCFLYIELFLIIAFSSLDLFLFFIAFEGILIPIFLLVGIWGHQIQKIKAAYYFFIYTFIGSIFILFAILILYIEFGSLNYYILQTIILPFQSQLIIWICLFIPFLIKIPVFPVHIWLPEAHVEAPTSGSIILAALLLKLGVYGILRFLITICFDANFYFLPFSYTLLTLSLIYTALTTLRQVDLKRIIAYSSITHINYATLGILTFSYYTIQGGIILIIAHGFISTGLFFLIGILYDRTHTRLIEYYSGLVILIPLYTFYLFIFCLANFGLPLTFNFIGEFLILIGIVYYNLFIVIFIVSGIFLSLVYTIWIFNRLSFGNLKINFIKNYIDLTRREFLICFPLFFLSFFFGIFPNLVLYPLDVVIKGLFLV